MLVVSVVGGKKGRVLERGLQVWVVLLHGVARVVEHQTVEGVKLVGRCKAKAAVSAYVHWDTLVLVAISARIIYT